MWMRNTIILVAIVVSTAACRITDQKVRDEIARRGGVILMPGDGIPLEGEVGMRVRERESNIVSRPNIEIVPDLGAQQCRDRCWETVSREYLDGEPVLDPGKLEEDANLSRELTRRAQNGYFADVPGGAGLADGACDPGKRQRQDYFDAPNFPDDDFDSNEVNDSARVYVLEQETCLRCLDPRGKYLGCVKWYYVKVRGDDVSRPIVKVVTTGQVSLPPSENFRRAVDAWNRP